MLSWERVSRPGRTGESCADRFDGLVVEVEEVASTFERPAGYYQVTTGSRGPLSRTREGPEVTTALTESSNVSSF